MTIVRLWLVLTVHNYWITDTLSCPYSGYVLNVINLPKVPFLIIIFCFDCKFFWLSSWYPKSVMKELNYTENDTHTHKNTGKTRMLQNLTKDILVLFWLVPTTEEYVRCQAPCDDAEGWFIFHSFLTSAHGLRNMTVIIFAPWKDRLKVESVWDSAFGNCVSWHKFNFVTCLGDS